MAKLKVEVLAPRTVVVGSNADGSPVYRTFTADDCKRYASSGNEMLKSGIAVPACWGHRSDAKPRKADDAKSDFAKGTTGWIERYDYDQGAGGKVFAVVDVPNEDDAKRAEIVRYASPEIDRFIDGRGKDWGEVVTHLALTPRPRQHDQQRITRLGMNGKGSAIGPIRLALDPQEGTDMADETDKTTPEGGATSYFAEAIEHLANKGINLPEDTTPENVWERIVVACMQGETEPSGEEEDLSPDQVEPVEPTSPIMMGFEKQKKVAVAMATKNIATDISSLLKSGRITPAIEKNLRSRLSKVQLSFDSNGELKRNDLLIEIDAYKKLPKNSSWSNKGSKTRLSHDADVDVADDPPLLGNDEPTSKQVEEFADQWDAMVGRSKK